MKGVLKILAIGALSVGWQQAQAITIELDYSYDTNGFFSDQSRKNILNSAASYFENRINDSLTAINSSGINHYNATFSNPGGTGSSVTLSDLNIAANTIRVYAGGRNLDDSTIGEGGRGGYSLSGTQTFLDSSVSRGQGDGSQAAVKGTNAYDYALWGGAITFDTRTETAWYFDNDINTVESFSGSDFYSVALHELGHLLGIGAADSWDNLITAGEFTGSASRLENGGADVPLASGGSHWQSGTMSLVDALEQEVAMDPSITTGTRKYFTDLDLAGLSDVGWEVTTVPVPAAVYFFGSALLGLGAFRKKSK